MFSIREQVTNPYSITCSDHFKYPFGYTFVYSVLVMTWDLSGVGRRKRVRDERTGDIGT